MDSAIRRALLRKSQPHPGTYEIGQLVLYWKKRNTTGRRETGRWHGPARVVCQDGSTTIWVAHGDRLLRCSPESLRPASLREWQNASESLNHRVQSLQNPPDGPKGTLEFGPSIHEGSNQDETYTPGTPIDVPEVPISSQTSIQPESELFPEPITSNVTTPVISPNQSITDNPSFDNFPNFESENAIDLDTPTEEPVDAAETENVLSCYEISDFLQEDPIHEWNVFQSGTESYDICLAEDGLPFLDEPMCHHDHQCFMLEVPMSCQDLLQWSQSSHPEELAQVASAGKRARAEVQIKDLTAAERRLFDTAKKLSYHVGFKQVP